MRGSEAGAAAGAAAGAGAGAGAATNHPLSSLSTSTVTHSTKNQPER